MRCFDIQVQGTERQSVGVLLEIKTGLLAGKKIALANGESILIGRVGGKAQFAVPQDNFMSSVHFAVEASPNGCKVFDRKSSNGTFLNGARIKEGMLATGDEIKSGQTVFAVRIVPDAQLPTATSSASPAESAPAVVPKKSPAPDPTPIRPPEISQPHAPPNLAPNFRQQDGSQLSARGREEHPVNAPPRVAKSPGSVYPTRARCTPPALSVGSWVFAKIPAGWQIQEGLGIQLDTKNAFPSNVGAMEEALGPGISLQQYVEAQTKMFREYLREPKIDASLPPTISGSAETIALEVRYSTKDGHPIYYHRVYARAGSTVGVLTLTTLEADLPAVRPAYDSLLSGATFVRRD